MRDILRLNIPMCQGDSTPGVEVEYCQPEWWENQAEAAPDIDQPQRHPTEEEAEVYHVTAKRPQTRNRRVTGVTRSGVPVETLTQRRQGEVLFTLSGQYGQLRAYPRRWDQMPRRLRVASASVSLTKLQAEHPVVDPNSDQVLEQRVNMVPDIQTALLHRRVAVQEEIAEPDADSTEVIDKGDIIPGERRDAKIEKPPHSFALKPHGPPIDKTKLAIAPRN